MQLSSVMRYWIRQSLEKLLKNAIPSLLLLILLMQVELDILDQLRILEKYNISLPVLTVRAERLRLLRWLQVTL